MFSVAPERAFAGERRADPMPDRCQRHRDDDVGNREEWIEGNARRARLILEEEHLACRSLDAHAASEPRERDQGRESDRREPTDALVRPAARREHADAEPDERCKEHEVREVPEHPDLAWQIP